MGWKSKIIWPAAWLTRRRIAQKAKNPLAAQEKVFRKLIQRGASTAFGKEHRFGDIQTHTDFAERVPIRDYEGLRPWVDRITHGEKDILWPGKPAYFAKTSGTTSGVKYIPITRESLPNHIHTARDALFNFYAQSGIGDFFDGKLIFLSGSPELDLTGGIPTGRLSGIVNHEVPSWLRSNQKPSYKTNCIDAWEEKLEAIVTETINEDMRLISGIPPWVQMYYERLLEKSGKSNILELFPNLRLFVYGGVNFEPYRKSLEALVGAKINSLETYPASEGFIAYQDSPDHQGLLLNVDSGIFFEFVPAGEIFDENPTRLSLREVETGVNYALILSNNAGLWAYNLGDTVEFVSTNPYRLRVSGRIKHFISAFGEHVIGKEVEEAMQNAVEDSQAQVREFTVAPQVKPPTGGTPYHEWFIEFESEPKDLELFAEQLDQALQEQNIYYQDLIEGGILKRLKVSMLKPDAFRTYMKSQGKLGGQNKVPRLSNDRNIADQLTPFIQNK